MESEIVAFVTDARRPVSDFELEQKFSGSCFHAIESLVGAGVLAQKSLQVGSERFTLYYPAKSLPGAVTGASACGAASTPTETPKKDLVLIELLHTYNEVKDSAQELMGRLAEIEGITVRDVHERFGLSSDD